MEEVRLLQPVQVTPRMADVHQRAAEGETLTRCACSLHRLQQPPGACWDAAEDWLKRDAPCSADMMRSQVFVLSVWPWPSSAANTSSLSAATSSSSSCGSSNRVKLACVLFSLKRCITSTGACHFEVTSRDIFISERGFQVLPCMYC